MTLNEIYYILLKLIFISAPIIFILLIFLSAPYGRHTRKGWGLMIPAKISWIIMEMPSLAIPVVLLFYADTISIVAIIFLIIWQMHYFQRTIIFPLLIKPGAAPMPILIVLFSITFNLINSFINGYFIFFLSSYSTDWLHSPQFVTGIIIFFSGYYINLKSDSILRNLRKPGETGYKIPQGGMYKYISSPNYFGEILEWTGWAILTWSLPGLAFMLFTMANLIPRAMTHHLWYRENFANYPNNRKIIFPFIF